MLSAIPTNPILAFQLVSNQGLNKYNATGMTALRRVEAKHPAIIANTHHFLFIVMARRSTSKRHEHTNNALLNPSLRVTNSHQYAGDRYNISKTPNNARHD